MKAIIQKRIIVSFKREWEGIKVIVVVLGEIRTQRQKI